MEKYLQHLNAREQFIARLKKCYESDDTEQAHRDADDILCEALAMLGYNDIVSEYKRIYKWYA